MIFASSFLNISVFSLISGFLSFPVIYSALNIDQDQNNYLFTEYNNVDGKKSIEQMSKVTRSYIDLIKGDVGYNNGDYVMYIGSEFCPHCNQFLYTENQVSSDWDEETKALFLKNSNWHSTYKFGALNGYENLGKKLKFVIYSDKFETEDDKLKVFPHQTQTDDGVNSRKIKEDFLRYDESAINMRKIRSVLEDTIGKKAVDSIPKIICYKRGNPLVWGSDKFKGIEASNKLWDELQSDKPKEQKEKRPGNTLLEFMQYWYKKNGTIL